MAKCPWWSDLRPLRAFRSDLIKIAFFWHWRGETAKSRRFKNPPNKNPPTQKKIFLHWNAKDDNTSVLLKNYLENNREFGARWSEMDCIRAKKKKTRFEEKQKKNPTAWSMNLPSNSKDGFAFTGTGRLAFVKFLNVRTFTRSYYFHASLPSFVLFLCKPALVRTIFNLLYI